MHHLEDKKTDKREHVNDTNEDARVVQVKEEGALEFVVDLPTPIGLILREHVADVPAT